MHTERDKKKFILSHLILILSLTVVSQIPRLYPMIHEKYLPPMDRYLRFYIIGVFSVVFLAYYLCIYFCAKSGISIFKAGGLSVYFWASTVSVFLVLCASSAILSHDLYEYSIRARMLSIYGLNPYLHVPFEIKEDLFYPYIFWKTTPECYGPLWVLIGLTHSFFFKTNLALTSFMHKAVLLLFLLAGCFVFRRICKEVIPKYADITTSAFLLNPLIVILTLADGHNEIAMAFFILSAFYLLIKSRYGLSLVSLALAINIKFVYILIVPFFVLYILFNQDVKGLRQRIYELLAGAFLSVLITVILWAPFGMKSVRAIISYYTDLSKNFWVDSIPFAVYFVSDKIGLALAKGLIANIFSCIFAAAYLFVLIYFIRKIKTGKQAIFTSTALILLALLFTNSTPFQAWYIIWVLPFIYLSDMRLRFQLAFLLSYFLIMTFWKRMFVLATPMIITYFFVFLYHKKVLEKSSYKNA